MEQINVCIRADGSSKIGMGHLMRTLSIAIALKEKQINVFYITKETESKIFVEEKGFPCYQVPRIEDDISTELDETIRFIKEHDIRLLIVDTYEATTEYLGALNEIVPVFYLDDLGRMDLPISGLINYNVYGNEMGYEKAYGLGVKLLLGSRYAPVKPQFLETPFKVRESVKNVLITMGGSDALNITGRLSEMLLETMPKSVSITAICGRFNPNLKNLEALAQKETRLKVLTDVPDMWNKMAEADLCIASASSTMYELSTMGVPTICCYYVENQRRIAEGFTKLGLCNAGDFSIAPDNVIEKIKNEVDKLLNDDIKRMELSTIMKKTCDGKGAIRIADKIQEVCTTERK